MSGDRGPEISEVPHILRVSHLAIGLSDGLLCTLNRQVLVDFNTDVMTQKCMYFVDVGLSQAIYIYIQ